MKLPIAWADAREAVFAAGSAAAPAGSAPVPLVDSDGLTLAEPLTTLTDLPAFPTSSVDGWAVRGDPPWRIVGRVLAGDRAEPLTDDGTCVEIATGGMVPAGVSAVVRVEDSTLSGDVVVAGEPRRVPDWREPGEEAKRGEELLPAGTPVTPGVIGLAAACGYDTLPCYPAPRSALLVFGDELLTAGPPGDGRVRDALGPALPSWLRRAGTDVVHVRAPVADTLDDHVAAIEEALEAGGQVVCTTGGTMHGPVDHLHPALARLGARYVVNTVAVRPGFPMLVARLPGGQFVAGLPGNPQSTFVALVSLVVPLLAGLTGRPLPALPPATLGADIPGRGDFTHLALVRRDPVDGLVYPVPHAGSSMLRGLARSIGFAVVPPGAHGHVGTQAPVVPLPMLDGERP